MSLTSVEHFKKAKYLYVVYPGATGGNHVCNMISICEGFGPRVKKPNYTEWMLKKYKRVGYEVKPPKFVNAHVDDSIHHVDRLYEYVDKDYLLNANEKIIIQGHLFNFWSAIKKGVLKELGNDYVGIVLDYPSEGSMAHDRIKVYGYESIHRDYTLPLVIEYLDYNVTISEDNGFHIDTIKLFTEDGSQYLRELLRDTFELELPLEADEMHRLWFTWMKHVVNPEVVEFWKNR